MATPICGFNGGDEEERMPSGKQTKRKRGFKWQHEEVKKLLEVKRDETALATEKMPTLEKWALISKSLAKAGIEREPHQCKTKWDNLQSQYRTIKVYNMNSATSAGGESSNYWSLSLDERNSQNLPAMEKDVYELMEAIIGNKPIVIQEGTKGLLQDTPFKATPLNEDDFSEDSDTLSSRKKMNVELLVSQIQKDRASRQEAFLELEKKKLAISEKVLSSFQSMAEAFSKYVGEKNQQSGSQQHSGAMDRKLILFAAMTMAAITCLLLNDDFHHLQLLSEVEDDELLALALC